MDHDKINQEVRLIALETVLVHVAKVAFVALGVSEETVRQSRLLVRDKLSKGTLPGLHPALSDHYSAEIETAVDELMGSLEKSVADAYQALRRASDQGTN